MTASQTAPAAPHSSAPPVSLSPVAAGNPARKKALLAITALVVLGGFGWAGYEWLVASHEESTDNAYVQGNVIQITPQIGGTVTAILADDTDRVVAGQPLVRLDTADAQLAMAQAQANLAQVVRQVRTLYANNTSLGAQVAVRESDVARAQVEIARARDDLTRRQALLATGAVSREEVNHAQSQLETGSSLLATAQAGVTLAREQLRSNQTMTQGTNIPQHPSVLAAAGRYREAWLASRRAALPAPVDGFVARRTVQLGQRVAAGTPLMAIVPLGQLWVDANFKEVQLRHIRLGQPVKLTADLYGKKMTYTGTVAGLGMGTGAAFALLPAQNATGNWIKVVQRVPVRVHLDPTQLASHPLRVGLSMEVTVDVTRQDGKMLADAPRPSSGLQTAVFDAPETGADDEIQKIIKANQGR